jgi:hypothetical protein
MTMMRGVHVCSLVAIACMTLAAAGFQGDSQSPSAYRVPKTSFGQPNLEGVWSNNSATPLQRPAAWADKQFLTDAEVEQVQKTARQLEQDGDALFGDELITDTLQGKTASQSHDTETGNYNGFWLPARDFERRTSLIIDPPNGRIPPETPEAQRRRAALAEQRRLHPADGPESRGLTERCITFGVPRFQAAYSSVYQIVQSPTHVVFNMETIHDARVIPIDGRPHLSQQIPQWLGDSRGHWEGDTLVVDTKGFSPKSNFQGASSGLHLVERFTRIAAGHASVRCHDERSDDVDEPMDGAALFQAHRRAAPRVRMPRGESRDVRDSRGGEEAGGAAGERALIPEREGAVLDRGDFIESLGSVDAGGRPVASESRAPGTR